MGYAKEYVDKKFGTHTRDVDNPTGNLALGAAAEMFLGNNPDRVAFVFVNLSANAAYIKPGRGPSATNGIYIAANGGVFIGNIDDDALLTTREWWGITPAGASNIYVLEIVAS